MYHAFQLTLSPLLPRPTVINPANLCEREQGLIQGRLPLPLTPVKQSATEGLTLNISLPASLNIDKDAGLPVMVFVHGGGFANGSANHPHYDLARIIELSVKEGSPIIAIGLKYVNLSPGVDHFPYTFHALPGPS